MKKMRAVLEKNKHIRLNYSFSGRVFKTERGNPTKILEAIEKDGKQLVICEDLVTGNRVRYSKNTLNQYKRRGFFLKEGPRDSRCCGTCKHVIESDAVIIENECKLKDYGRMLKIWEVCDEHEWNKN